MVWKVLENFEVQHKALKEKKDRSHPEVPQYHKLLSTPKWVEYIKIHMPPISGI